jgi:spore germination protein GerM
MSQGSRKQNSTQNRKKGGSRSRTAPAKKKSRNTTQTKKGRDTSTNTAMYALAIMVLMTVIIILINYLFDAGRITKRKENTSDKVISLDFLKDKKTVTADADKSEKEKAEEKSVSEQPVRIYLIHFNDKTEHVSLIPVKRNIQTDFPLRDAMHELIKGPTESEKKRGILSAVPADLKIKSIRCKDGIATIDFNETIEEGANGSILLHRIDQIVFTATQFNTINGIRITINGKNKKFIGSDGLSIGGSLYRRRL